MMAGGHGRGALTGEVGLVVFATVGLLGLGTVPEVFGYGVAFNLVSPRSQSGRHRTLDAVFLVLGYLPLLHGLMLLGIELPHPSIPIYRLLG